MIIYYLLDSKAKTGMLELQTKAEEVELLNNFTYEATTKLLKKIKFKIKPGKKSLDVISYFDKTKILFLSQNFIDLLSKHIDVSEICYPVNIEGVDMQYYCLYNLKGYSHFNKRESEQCGEPFLFYDDDENLPFVFTIKECPMIIVKDRIGKKFYLYTNIVEDNFVYSYSKYELEGWKSIGRRSQKIFK